MVSIDDVNIARTAQKHVVVRLFQFLEIFHVDSLLNGTISPPNSVDDEILAAFQINDQVWCRKPRLQEFIDLDKYFLFRFVAKVQTRKYQILRKSEIGDRFL